MPVSELVAMIVDPRYGWRETAWQGVREGVQIIFSPTSDLMYFSRRIGIPSCRLRSNIQAR